MRATSASGVDLARRRQLLVFDRFLARIVGELGDSAMIKGGLVVELCVERARTTKDIDLRLIGPPTGILERLQRAARHDTTRHDTISGSSWCSPSRPMPSTPRS
ncbi:MAG TPA: nucleotidyl transferase AbiEii/AbiGii toxin family protein [Polyangiaceae bacterium]